MKRSKHWKKHKMLQALISYDKQNFDDPPYYGGVKSYWLEMGDNIFLNDSEDILNSLSITKDVFKKQEDEIPYEYYYKITDKGRSSYYEKTYLNKIWYRSKSNWSFILSAFAILISLFALFRN